MGKRRFTVGFIPGNDWAVVEESIAGKGGKCSGDFTDIGAAHCYSRGGKLVYLFDYRVTDEMIAAAEKKRMFAETVVFVPMVNGKKEAEFAGTFIDVLRYLKPYF